jgi:hypothetical protein
MTDGINCTQQKHRCGLPYTHNKQAQEERAFGVNLLKALVF